MGTMDYNYSMPTLKNVKVADSKDTEPAFYDLFDARRIRKEREEGFDRSKLKEDRIEDYIESIGKELRKRNSAMRFQVYEIGRLLCAEPVNNFWTLTVKNYCSFLLSCHASTGGLIHTACGKAGGNGTPLTNLSG